MAPHLLDSFVVDEVTDCWKWNKSKSKDGYGWASLGNKTYQAHRLFYSLVKGPVPKGMVLDHLCRCRHCVNPDHLEPVTPLENLKRSEITTAGRECCQKCGGEFSLVGKAKPQRRCLACAKEQRNRYRIKNKQRLEAAQRKWNEANRDKLREYGRRHDAKQKNPK